MSINKKRKGIPSGSNKKRVGIHRIEAGGYPLALEYMETQRAYKATHIAREQKRLEWLDMAIAELKKRLGV